MSRDRFVKAFGAYLDIAAIRDQRLKDDPNDTAVRTYYHVVTNGIDFITLDNGSCDMFDDAQMAWLRKVLARDAADASIRTVVLGAHAALPDSRSCGHSMGNYPNQQKTGREVYNLMLAMRDKSKKQVYVLASHSHFVMDNVYDSDYWRKNGGVLPGWIVGTSGAVRYRLPETATPGPNTRTDVYGYLLGTVSANGAITFEFRELTPKDIPARRREEVLEKFRRELLLRREPQHLAAARLLSADVAVLGRRLTDQFRTPLIGTCEIQPRSVSASASIRRVARNSAARSCSDSSGSSSMISASPRTSCTIPNTFRDSRVGKQRRVKLTHSLRE